jgi:hypothetical protein
MLPRCVRSNDCAWSEILSGRVAAMTSMPHPVIEAFVHNAQKAGHGAMPLALPE